MIKKNERVGAILSVENKMVNFLGYGVYEGDFYPEEAVGMIAEIKQDLVKTGEMTKETYTNPRIRLDNGSIVYGCECWWGSERIIKEKMDYYLKNGYTIIDVCIEKKRDDYKNPNKV